jgi:hypothetical protein
MVTNEWRIGGMIETGEARITQTRTGKARLFPPALSTPEKYRIFSFLVLL